MTQDDKVGVSARNPDARVSRISWGALPLESWQIADGGDLRAARAQVTSVGDFRVRFVVKP
eukprot:scaffold17922_cov40-Phaeocystis_antarctica.AAC.1